MKDKEISQLLKKLEKQAKHSYQYKQLTSRTYRQPHGYISYEEVALSIAINLMFIHEGFKYRGFTDTAFNSMMYAGSLAVKDPVFPVFAITSALCEAFMQTDLPAHVCSVRQSFNQALLLLPPVLKSPDGLYVRWLLCRHWLKGDFLLDIDGLPNNVQVTEESIEINKLSWVSELGNRGAGLLYSSTFELPEDSLTPRTGSIALKTHANSIEQEQEFLRSVDKLLLQTLLYMQTKPDGLSTIAPARTKTGTGFNKPKEQSLLEPIWIGKDYEQKREINKTGSSHGSPRMHWRRGHWKRVAIGEGRVERKWVWIEPTLVNAE